LLPGASDEKPSNNYYGTRYLDHNSDKILVVKDITTMKFGIVSIKTRLKCSITTGTKQTFG